MKSDIEKEADEKKLMMIGSVAHLTFSLDGRLVNKFSCKMLSIASLCTVAAVNTWTADNLVTLDDTIEKA